MCDMKTVANEIASLQNELNPMETTNSKYNAAEPTLLKMPVEIILKICSFLEVDFLITTLSKVCTRFESIFNDDLLWKYWVHSKVKGCFPSLPDLNVWQESQIDWKDVCIEMAQERRKWVDSEETMKHMTLKDVHFASVDSILLLNNAEVCISGSRDRGIAVWSLSDIIKSKRDDDIQPISMLHDAHEGWVWDLAADNVKSASTIYSASWDSSVKEWDLHAGLVCVNTYPCQMSALSVATTNDNVVAAGLYSKKVLFFDNRSGPSHIKSYEAHKGPVISIGTHKNHVASISEDRALAIWDRVAGKVLVKKVKIPTDNGFPICINWSSSALYIGDTKGCLHLVHPEKYTFLKTYEIFPSSYNKIKVVSCHQTASNLIVCSEKGDIKFSYNCYPPQEYATIKCRTPTITKMQYQNGIMAVGTCENALEFWIPYERFN